MKVEFDEARALALEGETRWFYPPAVALQLWALDEERNEARGQSAYDWALVHGQAPDATAASLDE